MNYERPIDIVTATTEIYKKRKGEYLEKPETFVFEVVHDAKVMSERRSKFDKPFWI